MDSGEQYVITGCITAAADLLPHHTFLHQDGVELTRAQQKEMTRAKAELMAVRLKQQPLLVEHQYEQGGLGEILHSWVDDAQGWMIQARINNTLRGAALVRAYLNGHATQLSLGHDDDDEVGVVPAEVSVVKEGARRACNITSIQRLAGPAIDEIRAKVYKPSCRIPVNQIAGWRPPKICCAWSDADSDIDPTSTQMSSHTMLRAPAQAPSYVSGSLNPEAQKIIQSIDATANAQPRRPNQNPNTQQQGPPPSQPGQSSMPSPSAMTREQLMAQLASMDAQDRAQGQQPRSLQDRQFDAITDKLSHGVSGDSTAENTGNTHVVFSSPREALPHLLDLINNNKRNFLTNEQKQTSRDIVFKVAQEQVVMEDELKRLREENKAMKSDKNAMMADNAKLFFKKGGLGDKEYDQFIKAASQGDNDGAMKVLMPAAIQCSARLQQSDYRVNDPVDNQMSDDVDDGSDDHAAIASQQQLHRLLNTARDTQSAYRVNYNSSHSSSAPAIQMSANHVTGKRTRSSMQDEPTSANQAHAASWLGSGIDQSLASVFAETDKGLDTTNMFSLQSRKR